MSAMTSAACRKLRRLANALSPEDLRALAIEVGMPQAHSRQLPGLVDALVVDHHDALLDRIELRINEASHEAADRSTRRPHD